MGRGATTTRAKSRTAWWFVGFAPVDKPQYAYASLVEGDAGDNRHSGETAVPLIGKVLREVYKDRYNPPTTRRSIPTTTITTTATTTAARPSPPTRPREESD